MMNNKHKKVLRRILLGGVLLILISFLPLSGWPRLVLHMIPYGILGGDVLWRACKNLNNGQVFDEHFLMSVATVGAFFCGEYTEGVAVMLFYQVGELFQSVAVHRSRQSIAALMDIRPDYANLEQDGQLIEVDPDEVSVGQIIVVKPGERVPLDGILLEGASSLDTSALTGESLPTDVTLGDEVISGCINLSGLIRVQVTKPFQESTVSRILEMVEHAASKKATAENFITKFARYYTPLVVYAALILAFFPPLVNLLRATPPEFMMWFKRALVFLVVSCPCALVISIPLSFFGGIGGASKKGILMKGGNYLEALAHTGIVVFDKTGTLTQGTFSVCEIHPVNRSEEELLTLAALAEQWSSHPIARSILAAAPDTLDRSRCSSAEELPGYGLKALVDGVPVWVGNARLMEQARVVCPPVTQAAGAVIHLAVHQVYAGYLVIADQIKENAAASLASLKQSGIRKTVMLTGDTPAVGQAVADVLGLDEVHAGLLPADKVDWVERLLSEKRSGEQLLFVGDGINDAPVLSRADLGAAMGAMGSDAAMEAADLVLMDDDLSKLSIAIEIARKTLRIVQQNIVLALGVKFLVMGLSVFGRANLWMAVFADVGVAILAILNASRMLRV